MKCGVLMSDDKFEDQRICEDGFRAGWEGYEKKNNPYMNSGSEKEHHWNKGWEKGQRDREKESQGLPFDTDPCGQ